MRKLLVFASAFMALCACEETQELQVLTLKLSSDDPQVSVSQDRKTASFTLSPAAADVTLGLETNMELTIDNSGEGWCHPTISEGSLTVAVDAYQGDEDRKATLRLIYRTVAMGTVEVTQSARATLELETQNLRLNSMGETRQVAVTTNQSEWSATSDALWLTCEKGDGVLTLTATPNDSGDTQHAVVTVTAGEGKNTCTKTIEVTQNNDALVIELTVTRAGGKMRPPIEAEVDCTVDWGDGTSEEIKQFVNPLATPAPQHVYAKAGTYMLRITGKVERLSCGLLTLTDEHRSYITRVVQWGHLEGLVSMEGAFTNCENLVEIAGNNDNSFEQVTTFKSAFNKCTSLKEIPEDLFTGCHAVTTFRNCFQDCDALTAIPEKLFWDCPQITGMQTVFGYCDKLKDIPAGLFAKLPNVTSFDGCFTACSALETVPAGLFDNNPEATDFSSLFYNCTSFKSIPENFFSQCKKAEKFTSLFVFSALESVPENLFEGCTEATNFQYTFASCASLKTIPEKIFATNTKATNFWGVFKATGLETVPENIFASCPQVTTFQYLFWQCPELISVPEKLFANNALVKSFDGAFRECAKLETVPAGLFAACTEVTNFSRLFLDAGALKSIPAALFDNNRKVTNFSQAFRNCTALEGESPYTLLEGAKVHLYERVDYPDLFANPRSHSKAFDGCTALSDWAAIEAAGWK